MPVTPTRDRVDPETVKTTPLRRPDWIKVRAPGGETYEWLQGLMRSKALHTVCEEAMCPNMGECWGAGTATFLMLGDVCTRSCGFCDIKRGQPAPLDWLEPERIAQAVKSMNLKHAVITSVNRDDRKDGGAPIFAMVIRRIRQIHRQIAILTHQLLHAWNVIDAYGQDLHGSGFHHVPQCLLRPPRKTQQMHRFRNHGPHGAERLVHGREGVSTTFMFVIVCMYEGDKRPRVDEDHRHLRARSTSMSWNFFPASTERFLGPPLTQPIR